MKRVLVTGATGFIGRNCVSLLLAKGYQVHVVSSRDTSDLPPETIRHRADLLDPAQVRPVVARIRPEYLLHLAWYVVPGQYMDSRENLSWLAASLHLAREFAEAGGKRLVIAGTCAEYDGSDGPLSEVATPLAPVSLYSACKHSLHVAVEAFSRQCGLSFAWGRIFFVFGPNEPSSRLVPGIITAFLEARPFTCRHAHLVRDFLYVKDVAAAFVQLLLCCVEGPVNVASGVATGIGSLVQMIACKMGTADLVHLEQRPTSEPARMVAGNARLFEEVGWRPAYTLDMGLEETIAWWTRQQSADAMPARQKSNG